MNSVERARRGIAELQPKLSLVGIDDLGPSVPLVLPIRDGAVPAALATVARIAGFIGKPDETVLLPVDPGSCNLNRKILLLGLGAANAAEAAGPRAAVAL